jgi:LysR family glycine cleavage system transcriptional activator
MLPNVPLNALRAFAEVAQLLSFTRAAEALHVTQSAVSQQVAQLEQRLGKRLIERSGRTLRLTESGEMLAAACQRGFGVIDSALRRVARAGDASSLRFKLPPTFAMRWLMPRLPSFQVLHPGCELHVSTSVQTVDFEAEDVDIALQRAVHPEPAVHAIPVIEERGILVCSPTLWRGRQPDLGELEGMTVLHSANRRSDWAQWLAAVGRPDLKAGNLLEFEFSLMVYQAAMEGLGVAIAQPEFVETELASGRLVAPVAQAVPTGKRYFLTCQSSRRHVPAIASFFSWAAAEVRASSKTRN